MSEKKKKLALVLSAVMVFMTSVTSFAAESILSEAENDIQAEVAEEISANDEAPLPAEEEGGTTGEDALLLAASDEKTDYSKENGYMVCIWDISQNGGVVFGPAAGSDPSCLSVNGKDRHCLSYGHCIACESWEEIIQNINSGHTDWYRGCMEEGCTHNVEITGNAFFGTVDSQCSVLYTSVSNNYRQWNYVSDGRNCESANYAASRIRATLNGKTGEESTYAGNELLDNTNCLFSCFPKVLQGAITCREMKVATKWKNNHPYPIEVHIDVSDRLWLANAVEIYGTESAAFYVDYGNQFQKAIQAGTCTSNYSQNKVFDEAGLARWTWLRSPARRVMESAAAIYSDGNLTSYPVNRSTLGLSPFFLLGEASGYSSNTDGIKSTDIPKPAIDIPKPAETRFADHVYHTDDTSAEKLFTGTEGAPVSNGTWTQNADGTWSYTTTRKFTDTWGYIANPWNDNKPAWFCFGSDGKMLTGWQMINWNGSYKFFYFREAADGRRGECLIDGVTPDGYTVNKDGAWTVDGVVQEPQVIDPSDKQRIDR
ncbi:MAG: hypothetical protein Q4A04_04220 [Eubacteriales bacterium]|nr:hypothetical protein [Eubacteriales bacterium]